MRTIKTLTLSFLIFLSSSCGQPEAARQVEEAAVAFATAYFNYDFATASKLSTPESARWLRFAASNVYEPDLEALRSMEGGAEVGQPDVESLGDTAALVAVAIDNYMQRDTIGQRGRVVGGQTYHLCLVRRGEKWLVSLDGLPRARP